MASRAVLIAQLLSPRRTDLNGEASPLMSRLFAMRVSSPPDYPTRVTRRMSAAVPLEALGALLRIDKEIR